MSDSREQFEAWVQSTTAADVSAFLRKHVRQDCADDYVETKAHYMWQAWQASRAQPERKLTDTDIAAMLVASENDLTKPKLSDDEIVDICDSRGWTQYSAPTLQQIAHAFYAEGCAAQRRAILAVQRASNPVIRDFRTTDTPSNSVGASSAHTADQFNDAVKKVEADHVGDTNEMVDDSRDWSLLDGTAAYHLIDRHAENWSDAGRMMNAWLQSKIKAQPAAATVPDKPPCRNCLDTGIEHGVYGNTECKFCDAAPAAQAQDDGEKR